MSRRASGPTAVLFDLDDTLYPERQFVDGGFRAVARFLAPLTGEPARTLASRLRALHERDGRGRLFDTLLGELGHPADTDLVLACLLTYRTHRPRLTPFPGVLEMLDAVRATEIPIGLVSDGNSAVQRRKLAALPGVNRRLDVVVLTDELGPAFAKPSPAGFRVACRLLAVEPSRAVYVGNDPRKDFAGARAGGLRTIRTGRIPDEGGARMVTVDEGADADTVVADVTDLAAAVLGSGRGVVGRP
jgi:putative hydrolase of the HAD superfamily